MDPRLDPIQPPLGVRRRLEHERVARDEPLEPGGPAVSVHVDKVLVSPRVEAARVLFGEKRELGGDVVAIVGCAPEGVAGEGYVGHGWVEEGASDGGAGADGGAKAFCGVFGGGE